MERYTYADLQQAANNAILAMDGKLRRADALLIARMVLEGIGMRRDHATFAAARDAAAKRRPLPGVWTE